jgi:hypothetical protein
MMRIYARRMMLLFGTLVGIGLLQPPEAFPKVFFYALTRDGDLVKYDPELDRVEVKPGAGQGYIGPRLEDSGGRQQTRILDMKRKRIVTLARDVDGPVVLDLQAGTAKEVTLGPPGTVGRIRQFIYPRQISRFYAHWLRKNPASSQPEVVLTAVGLDGRILGTSPSPLRQLAWPVYHPDGRSLYIFEAGRQATLIDGETLAPRATYDLVPLSRPGARGPGISDVRGGRALLAETTDASGDAPEPWTVFTTDLSFSPQSASPHIATGLDMQVVYLTPEGGTIVLQEALSPRQSTGSGRLHFYDVVTGNKLGALSFNAPEGANILGFHPDGRRLFIRVFAVDPATGDLQHRLVIVDVTTRTVVRDRPFERIGFASDFVDEP